MLCQPAVHHSDMHVHKHTNMFHASQILKIFVTGKSWWQIFCNWWRSWPKKKKNIFVAHTWRGLSLKIFTAFKQHRANNNRGVWFKTFTISPSAEQYKVYVWYYASNTFEYILNLHWMLHIYTVLMILTMCTNNHVFDSLLSTYSNIPSSWESSITLNASV